MAIDPQFLPNHLESVHPNN